MTCGPRSRSSRDRRASGWRRGSRPARELGDLSENADYHIAKEDQAHLETRIKRLRGKLKAAVVVEADQDAGAFAFGRTAEVLDEAADEVRTWTLVGSTEADLAPAVSRPSRPSAARCWTRPEGEAVEVETPRGAKSYRVQRLVG